MDPTPPTAAAVREQAILSLRRTVEIEARHTFRPKCVLLEDLISVAWMGAIKAVDRFEATRGTVLQTYALRRIRGELLDYLRLLDPLSRDHRKTLKLAERRGKKVADPSHHPDLSDPHIRRMVARTAARDDNPEEALLKSDAVRRAVATLKPRVRRLIRLRFWEDRTQPAIGADFGVNPSRVCQIQQLALKQLRVELEKGNCAHS